MKLLFDQNLSFKLCRNLVDLFPDSTQARMIGLDRADDPVLWEYAKANGFVLVSKDSEMFDLSGLRGHPPKLIWLRCGNQRTDVIEKLLRDHHAQIATFEKDSTAACLEIY
jgi:predicted nuclease of predicted toxin-antitoxin system